MENSPTAHNILFFGVSLCGGQKGVIMRALSQLEIELFDGADCVILLCGADVCKERGGGWRVTRAGHSAVCWITDDVLCAVYDFCGCDSCSLPCCAREGTAAARLRAEVQARRNEVDAARLRAIEKALDSRDKLRDVYDYCCKMGYIVSLR